MNANGFLSVVEFSQLISAITWYSEVISIHITESSGCPHCRNWIVSPNIFVKCSRDIGTCGFSFVFSCTNKSKWKGFVQMGVPSSALVCRFCVVWFSSVILSGGFFCSRGEKLVVVLGINCLVMCANLEITSRKVIYDLPLESNTSAAFPRRTVLVLRRQWLYVNSGYINLKPKNVLFQTFCQCLKATNGCYYVWFLSWFRFVPNNRV